jgi:hypothetical protein
VPAYVPTEPIAYGACAAGPIAIFGAPFDADEENMLLDATVMPSRLTHAAFIIDSMAALVHLA